MESGKLFIGGISWDTNEDRLRQYFQNFGEILEAVIIKDRNTGRARGFGFVVFADPYVAERVVKEKHVIDGRTVEAKKAVPRDDQLNRNNGSNQGSQSPAGTKKIFVGGLASTVTDSDMKKYFDQFGNITDVVVMYDHNTKRPRGFGFITYELEDAVDMVLLKPFHELNGKMVEVKRAVPRELSPSPVLTRSPLGFNRVTNFLTSPQGYNKSSIGDFGMRLEGRNGYVGQYNPSIDSVLSPEYAGNGMFSPNIGYGRVMNHPLSGAYTNNRYNGPVGYGGSGMDHGSDSIFNSTGRNMWVNENHPSYGSYNPKPLIPNDFFRSENRNTESLGAYGSIGTIWDSSSSGIGRDGGTGSYSTNNVNYDTGLEEEDNFMVNIGRSLVSNVVGSGDNYDKPFGGNVFASDSVFDDPTWQSSSTPNLVKSGNISYGLGKIASVGYVDDDYNVVSSITNRGIAA